MNIQYKFIYITANCIHIIHKYLHIITIVVKSVLDRLYAAKRDEILAVTTVVYNLKSDVNENEGIIVPRKGHAKFRENLTTKCSIVVLTTISTAVMVWFALSSGYRLHGQTLLYNSSII